MVDKQKGRQTCPRVRLATAPRPHRRGLSIRGVCPNGIYSALGPTRLAPSPFGRNIIQELEEVVKPYLDSRRLVEDNIRQTWIVVKRLGSHGGNDALTVSWDGPVP